MCSSDLVSDIVVQGTFPWEPSSKSFKELDYLFDSHFIKALDSIKSEEYRFPEDRHPYKHQIESWNSLLKENKSIAVTTGTGSGKTECFMLPVLQDIYTNSKNEIGVNAIFLYPLNALIDSQQKRLHAWCEALGGIQYGLLKGSTPLRAKSDNVAKERLPQLISRKQKIGRAHV